MEGVVQVLLDLILSLINGALLTNLQLVVLAYVLRLEVLGKPSCRLLSSFPDIKDVFILHSVSKLAKCSPLTFRYPVYLRHVGGLLDNKTPDLPSITMLRLVR